jgi:hypothetical protein
LRNAPADFLIWEVPAVIAVWINWQLVRERLGLTGMTERLVVLTKPGNSDGGKGLSWKETQEAAKD